MHDFRFDRVHLRGPDPDATATSFETIFGAEAKHEIYPPVPCTPASFAFS